MGGAVSSGRDNNELIDNLMSGNYIRTKQVERVLRALDRAEYMTPEARDEAYKDLAWRNGPLHLSSPCIYSEVMEGLELKPGLSFLNIGSGTGYLSTMAGLILGTSGISHGVEVHPAVYEYAVKKLSQFIENSPVLDDFDFCEPRFYLGNGLCLSPLSGCYDRVYCGAACTEEYENYFKRLIKVGGILVMPLNDTLQHVRRVGENQWVTRNMLNVSFATLRAPSREESAQLLTLDKQTPVRLQLLARAVVRTAMRGGVLRRHPELREAPRAPPPAACPRRICIPIEPGGAVEGLNVLHDLDSENGANEMNALLSLVISMGHNRVAGALRFDRVEDTPSDSEDEDNDDNDDDNARPRRDSRTDRSETDSRDNRDDRDSRGDRSEIESRGDRSETESRDERSETDSRDERLDSSRDEDQYERDTENKHERGSDKPNRASRVSRDSEDDRRPRRESKGKEDSRQSKRQRRTRGDGPDDLELFPPCRELLSYRPDEPSTSSKGSQRASGESTEKSEQSSSKDNNANSSKETKGTVPPGVPSEVEIDLGAKIAAQEASTSQMDWDENQSDTLEVSEDDTENTKSKAKRQKLDSGIGEEATPSSSSPDKSKTESDSDQSYTTTDDAASLNSARSEEECPELRAHAARRRRRVARGGDARRVRLSLLMKQAVRELPLPHALKKFVNLGRCFEF